MSVLIFDKAFVPIISEQEIHAKVKSLGKQLSADYAALNPVFLVLLKGAFVFASDLFRAINVPAEIDFVRVSSYEGTHSSGKLQVHLAPGKHLSGRHLILVEDIIDTGSTLFHFLPVLQSLQAESIRIVTLLSKPEALLYPELRTDYTGFEIPNQFVVGYGMDYKGYGRNLPAIYTLKQ